MLAQFAAQSTFIGHLDRLIDRVDGFGKISLGRLGHRQNMEHVSIDISLTRIDRFLRCRSRGLWIAVKILRTSRHHPSGVL